MTLTFQFKICHIPDEKQFMTEANSSMKKDEEYNERNSE